MEEELKKDEQKIIEELREFLGKYKYGSLTIYIKDKRIVRTDGNGIKHWPKVDKSA